MLSPYSPLHPLSRSDGVVIDSATSWSIEEEHGLLFDDASSEPNGLTVVPWHFHATLLLVLFANMALLRIPTVANTLQSLLSAVPVLDPNHKLQPVSFVDWLVHLPLMPLGSELCATLWRSRRDDSNISKHMAIIFGLNFIQGWIANLNHSLVGVNTELQNTLWSLSYWALRASIFMAGVVLWIPSKLGWGLSTLIGYGIWKQYVSFDNLAGRILASSALSAVLAQKSFSQQFKASYVLLALAPVFVPDAVTDQAHMVGAAYVACALALLVSSARKMGRKGPKDEPLYATITRSNGGFIIDLLMR